MLHIGEEAFHLFRKDWRGWQDMQQKMEGLTGNVNTNKKKIPHCELFLSLSISLTPRLSSLSSILSLRKKKLLRNFFL